jgi:hypothetical protein
MSRRKRKPPPGVFREAAGCREEGFRRLQRYFDRDMFNVMLVA